MDELIHNDTVYTAKHSPDAMCNGCAFFAYDSVSVAGCQAASCMPHEREDNRHVIYIVKTD